MFVCCDSIAVQNYFFFQRWQNIFELEAELVDYLVELEPAQLLLVEEGYHFADAGGDGVN